MRKSLAILIFFVTGCSGSPSIENSGAPVNDQVNAISDTIEEGSGRNDLDPTGLAPGPGRRGIMPQEPPR